MSLLWKTFGEEKKDYLGLNFSLILLCYMKLIKEKKYEENNFNGFCINFPFVRL
jgi:hypothetical protein